ncbi:MAG: hypothetical protein HY023_08790, partial [Chloroflexi bacterium]|nr:hypothetical protein [Chloroflexota bacterium]
MSQHNRAPATDRRLAQMAVASLILSVAFLAFNLPQTPHNSLWLIRGQESPRSVTWLWLDVVLAHEVGKPVMLRGYLWNEGAGEHFFDVESDGGLEIEMNGASVYRRPAKGAMMAESFSVELPAGATAITVNYQTADPITPRYEVSLSEGGRLIAPWRLYPDEPTPQLVTRQRGAWYGLYLGLALLVTSGVTGAIAALRSLTVSRRELLSAAAITAAAIAVRVIVALERYQTAP